MAMTTTPHLTEYSGLPDAPWLDRAARLVEALRSGDHKARILALLRSDDPLDRQAGCCAAAVRYLQVAEMSVTEQATLLCPTPPSGGGAAQSSA